MQIGVCTITSKSRSVADVIDIAAGLPADGIEVWGQDHIGDGSQAQCREIAEHAADRGLEIPVYGSYLRAGSAAFADEMERELRIAGDLGADRIRVWAGEQEHQDVSDEHLTAVIDDLTSLGEAAADATLEVTVERHAGTVTNTREGAAAVIDATPDSVGLNYQPMFEHAAAEIAPDVEALAPLANNVHIQAKPAVDGDERCPLAFAYFDVEGILAELADVGFDGYVEIEFVTERSPYRAALASDVAFLDAVLDELG